jgi:heme/copper-type cytochrome/quinol oxidase subunit 1
MTQTAPKPITSLRYARRHAAKGSRFLGMIRTTDPKDIAILYLVTSFAFFMVGGAMAMLIRRAGSARAAVPVQRAVQPAVHYAGRTQSDAEVAHN